MKGAHAMKGVANALGQLNWGKRAYAVLALCATTAIALPAQTLTTLHSFNGTDGEGPNAGLVQGTDGNFYGTTTEGGANSCINYSGTNYYGCGTVFQVSPSGTLTTLHSFNGTDGETPYAGLAQGTDGSFYGTTYSGGANDCGTVFKITPSGALTTLFNFNPSADGQQPLAGLLQGTDGDFYGTTFLSGSFGGTVFKITPSGTLTTLYNFCHGGPSCVYGFEPTAGLVQATDGNFYGTTDWGGDNGAGYGLGTVFKITPSGTLTTLYSFCSQGGYPNCTDGASPQAALVQGTDGNFYGTTFGGGAKSCIIEDSNGCGTIFKITPSGTLTTLYSFCSQRGCTDGFQPAAGLVQATDGDLYGTTSSGTIFKITPSGTLTTLYSFCAQSGCTDGSGPAGLVQANNGDLYGTTGGGGAHGYGTVFSLAVGLGPFVETEPTSGSVGAAVQILGTNLTGATSVTFSGIAAAFTVVSPTLISTTVPAGATTGEVRVTTPSGKLLSNVPFLVQAPLPTVETEPTSGSVGAAVQILGTNLTGAASVTFNGTAAAFTVVSASLISTTVPAGATTGEVQVTTPSGTMLSNVPFVVQGPPTVETQPTSGSVGAAVQILGTNLTGATSVTFNGIAAEFTVVSSSLISTTVPPGATTGEVQVTTPSGTFLSNVPFVVQAPAPPLTVALSTAGQIEPFAAQSIVAVYVSASGANLATGTASASGLPLPTSLDGTTVTVTDSAGVARVAPLFYVSPVQVNFEIPANTATGVASVSVQSQSGTAQAATIYIGSVSPGLFELNGSGLVAAWVLPVISGTQQALQPVYQIASGSVVPLPINLGPSTDQIYLEMYGTGIRNASNVTASVGSLSVPVLFAGAAPGFAGEDQVNIGPLPPSLAGAGSVNIVLTADGQAANTVNVTIQ
jgi:uncharacterized protein (TIGR03437 family)